MEIIKSINADTHTATTRALARAEQLVRAGQLASAEQLAKAEQLVRPDPSGAMLIGDGIRQVLTSYIAPDLVGLLVSPTDVTALLSRRSKAPRGFDEQDGGYAWKFNFHNPAQQSKFQQPLATDMLADYILRNLTSRGIHENRIISKARRHPEALNPYPKTPLFVLLGQHYNSQMLLNLQHVRHLSVRGAPTYVNSMMSSFAMDLLSDPFRSDVRIYLVGFGYDLEMFPQVAVCDKLSEVLGILGQHQHESMVASGAMSSDDIHWSLHPSVLPDLVIFAPTAESPSLLEELQDLNALSVTTFGEAPWMIELDEAADLLHPLDIRLDKRHLKTSADIPHDTFLKMLPLHDAKNLRLRKANLVWGSHRALLPVGADSADRLGKPDNQKLRKGFLPSWLAKKSAAVTPALRKPVLGKGTPGGVTSKSEKSERASGLAPLPKAFSQSALSSEEIRVCVLGPVQIEGMKKAVPQQCLDFICYLAFHRSGVTSEMILEALWQGRPQPHIRTVTSLVSRARSALGQDSQNRPLLPKVGAEKIYRLSPGVTTDYDEFCQYLRRARGDSAASLVHLRRALQLVRGAPFNGPGHRRYGWADFSLRVHMECLIDEAAHRLSDLALKFHDPELARWACYRAHKVVPGCEQCYIRRFKIAQMLGDRSELQSAMAELRHSVSMEGGDTISPYLLNSYLWLLENVTWR